MHLERIAWRRFSIGRKMGGLEKAQEKKLA
jgi:hypothetical protein